MVDVYGLLLTLIVGLFILLGAFIVLVIKSNDKIIDFSISIAFGVMVLLAIIEIFPEALELINENYSLLETFILVIIFSVVGILILRIFDYFIPNHYHLTENKEKNLYHIGLISGIALSIHNIIEGIAIFSSASTSISMGLSISLGVGIHNIPLGMIITSTLYKSNKSITRTILIISIISISTFIGGLIIFLNNDILSNTLLLGLLLSITLGMIIYIILFELLPHILKSKNKKIIMGGVITGIGVMMISVLLG